MERADPAARAITTAAQAPGTAFPPAGELLEMYRRMLLIRLFEERAAELYRTGDIPGFLHLSIGQEASAVGACWPLGPTDIITSTHRGHGHCIAKGMDVAPMIAELMGKVTGTNRGMGGSMHIGILTSACSARTASWQPACRSRWEPRPPSGSGRAARSSSPSSVTAPWPRAPSMRP